MSDSSRDVAGLIEELDGPGRRRALARLLTLVEDGEPERLREVIRTLYPRTGTARVIGMTGSPGVGKSTLTNAVAAELRSQGRTVGVIAVDPSSPFSGGALLGDRVRMQGHHADEGVFIRSMASRGHLGGLSFAAPQAALVLDAAGFDDVIIETVGVGQSEVEVAATADTTVVALAPGMGDGIQAAKAGILEVADVFVINKADHGGAGKLASEIRGMLEMGHAVEEVDPDGEAVAGWWPPIVRTVAMRPEGVDELVRAFDDHHEHLTSTGRLVERQRRRALHAIREIALEQIRSRFSRIEADGDPLLESLADEVAGRELDPYTAADRLLEAME
ncbi:MAG: methylmalonyl Co-A mutase-associated GTPase MeaB [Actinobacteria bacterium]|nr:methylmalonyl Co-A mutase-associated GTPase MeaB [Actinomycetota bacterium]